VGRKEKKTERGTEENREKKENLREKERGE
jgi:hypothetical protein